MGVAGTTPDSATNNGPSVIAANRQQVKKLLFIVRRIRQNIESAGGGHRFLRHASAFQV
jgi:hypothetical protein